MKLQHLITAALFAATLCPAAEEAPLTNQAADNPEVVALQQVLKDYVRCLKSVCELMENIHDKASAEAALPKIKSRMSLMSELSFGIGYIEEAEIEKALAAAGVSKDRAEAAMTGLVDNRFYGSVELAAVFGCPASAVLEPGEVTPELLQTLGAELKAALGNKVAGITGGPGFTEQTAWKMGNNPENLELIATIMETLPGAEKEDQTLVRTEEGPIYGRMTYTLPRDGKVYLLQMWFDITEIINAEEAAAAQNEEEEEEVEDEEPMEIHYTEPEVEVVPQEGLPDSESIRIPTEEEKAAAIQLYVQLFKESLDIVAGITDRASADAAVDKVKAIAEKSTQITVDSSFISNMDILEEMEKNGIDNDVFKQHLNRILEADFYGSEALENAMQNH